MKRITVIHTFTDVETGVTSEQLQPKHIAYISSALAKVLKPPGEKESKGEKPDDPPAAYEVDSLGLYSYI